jgi:hypothetical protein
MTLLVYAGAALAEIAGCFAFWAWLRLDKTPWWLVPGMGSLALFASLLTLVPSDAAGRAYAAYGASTSSRRSCGSGSRRARGRTGGTLRAAPSALRARPSSCSGREPENISGGGPHRQDEHA